MYNWLLKPLLFRLDAEKAHYLTLKLFHFALAVPGISLLFRKLYTVKHPSLRRQVFGLDFPNPVGLAAGFDKDGEHYRAMRNLGFGFIELGTVTPKPQIGNPKPRLFRLPMDGGLINRMGFNNKGVRNLAANLENRPANFIIGGNIGKNKTTPNEEAISDYEICFEALFPHVDYFVVNVSSPNTPNLRALQDKKPLTALLQKLQDLNRKKPQPKPILLKIAPDLTNGQLDDILDIVQTTNTAGVIATNTTISRDGLRTPNQTVTDIGAGGLSGSPVRDRSTQVIQYLWEKSGNTLPIIGVGGIRTAKDALEKLKAGACLVQVYSGMVYEGPGMIARINKGLMSQQ